MRPVLIALSLPIALMPLTVLAQERATGAVTIEQPPPRPRGFTMDQDGRPLTGVVAGAAEISGANVVVIEETARATRLTVQNDLLFDFDKADLRREASAALGRVAEIIRQRHPSRVRVIGHTDSLGSTEYNQTLSELRARSVEQWLAAQAGLPPMEISGRGEQEPLAPNATPEGRDDPTSRQRNRRVEVLLER